MSEPAELPPRPSLEQLRKQAKEQLRAGQPGITRLADAQRAIAQRYGFPNWSALARKVRELTGETAPLGPLIRPAELRSGRPYTLENGTVVTTDDVYEIFVAARGGDLARIKSLIARVPGLATVEYNYTPPIHLAVREGHLAIVELLIAHGADLAYRSYPFQESLLSFAEDRGHGEVAALLRRHLARRFALAPEVAAILEVAKTGDLKGVRSELERDPALARASNETGDTPLHQAAQHLHRDIVETLLDAGADPDAVRGDGYRPIHLALTRNFLTGAPTAGARSLAELLLARGSRYTMYLAALLLDDDFIRKALAKDRSRASEEDTNHHRPLSAAARRHDLELVRLLLEHGADPNAPEEGAPRGHSLWVAAFERQMEMVRLLLAHGADPNAMVESSGTPLMHAPRGSELRALLVAHGGIEEGDGPKDRLGLLLKERRFEEFTRLVQDHLDFIRDPDQSWGDGILAGPANAGDHEVLDLLIRLGARVPPVSKWAPYYYFKHEATARFLLERGMDPNHMNWHRFTLLHHMAAMGELGKAKLLLEFGADIDAIDEEYRSTPLGVAVRRGREELVKLLLGQGADPNLAGAPWATPLAWAKKQGHEGLVPLLTQAGAGSSELPERS